MVVGLGFSDAPARPPPKGLDIFVHSILASSVRKSSGSGVCQASCGDQPNQPVATAYSLST